MAKRGRVKGVRYPAGLTRRSDSLTSATKAAVRQRKSPGWDGKAVTRWGLTCPPCGKAPFSLLAEIAVCMWTVDTCTAVELLTKIVDQTE
eukprot:IDg6967t1